MLNAMFKGEPRHIVAFFNRDSAYLGTTGSKDFSYHDYRDSTIANYVPAATRLVKLGYAAIRLGAITSEAIDPEPFNVVDYPRRGRTPFLDLYIAQNSRFFLGTTSGLWELANLFRKPSVLANCAPLLATAQIFSHESIFIPKKYFDRNKKRFMSISEIVRTGASRFFRTDQFALAGIQLIENDVEEIAEAAIEMHARLERTWHPSKIDEEMQEAFWRSAGVPGEGRIQIASSFLRKYPELLC
jgi:putative glycosyltransferase (TIGR04372 family)